jgi:hypothetical protein
MGAAVPFRSEPEPLDARLVGALLPGGGWSYYPGKAPRIEPTCWALLALGAAPEGARVAAAIAAGRDFLASLQRDTGLLIEANGPANFGWNGLALLTDTAREPTHAGSPGRLDRTRLIAALVAAKGVRVDGSPSVVRQDSQLQAWPWIDQTFSWIEPTAYCLLALKQARLAETAAADRIAEAERLILDRVCSAGGWNYGNSQVYSQDLRPYVPTTALALLAMQDKRDHPTIRTSVDWLAAHATSETSAMALSLAAICLHVFDRPEGDVLSVLKGQDARTAFLGNLHLTAMAAYALALPRHQARAFRL